MGWRADISKLRSRANELITRANELRTQENVLNNIINSSRSYWEGEASDVYRKQVAILNDHIKRTRNKLSSSADELRRLAAYIQEVESERARAAREL